MNREELESMIVDAEWRVTSYLSPHEYVLSRDYPQLYTTLEGHLLDHGYKGLFLNEEYTYANIGAYRYWIADGVLNRARLDTPGVEEIGER